MKSSTINLLGYQVLGSRNPIAELILRIIIMTEFTTLLHKGNAGSSSQRHRIGALHGLEPGLKRWAAFIIGHQSILNRRYCSDWQLVLDRNGLVNVPLGGIL